MKFLIYGGLSLVVPFLIGLIPCSFLINKNTDDEEVRPGVLWPLLTGYMISWGVFQLVAVPMILKQQRFTLVAVSFLVLSLELALAGCVCFTLALKKGHVSLRSLLFFKLKSERGENSGDTPESNKSGRKRNDGKASRVLSIILWVIFLGLLLFQLLQSYRLAFTDGDDAFYLPVSVTALEADTMYRTSPYTGNTEVLDVRHGLGPFPIWVAYLAKFAGFKGAVMAQTMLPPVLILLTYAVYLEIGRHLLVAWSKKEKTLAEEGRDKQQRTSRSVLPLFMIFVAILQIFGNYSFYTSATFLLTRARQGKEALGNLILPMVFLLLLQISEILQTRSGQKDQGENGSKAGNKAGNKTGNKTGNGKLAVFFVMLSCTGLAACLCSTMGSFLFCMPVALAALLLAILYKKPKLLIPFALSCIPAGCFALLYILIR